MAKGQLDQAEKEFHRALEGFDTAINANHIFSRYTAARLGAIYKQQGKRESAAAMYRRVYESCLRLLGPDHWVTLEAQADLNSLSAKPHPDVSLNSSTPLAEHRHPPAHSDIKPSNALANPPDPSVSLGDFGMTITSPLCCHECGVPLTASTKQFVCWICTDHEVCGGCYKRHGMQMSKTQEGEASDHAFLPCDPPGSTGADRGQ